MGYVPIGALCCCRCFAPRGGHIRQQAKSHCLGYWINGDEDVLVSTNGMTGMLYMTGDPTEDPVERQNIWEV